MRIKDFLRALTLVSVVVLIVGTLGACSSEAETKDYRLVEDGVLTVASCLDLPPFEYEEDGSPAGYDIAVIQEVAKRLDLECVIVNTSFGEVLTDVSEGGIVDVGISSLSITSQRQETVDFSQPYYIVDQAVVTLKGKYLNVNELAEAKIAAKRGSTGFTYAQEQISDTVTSYEDVEDCFASLRSKKVQAVVADAPVARFMIKDAYDDCEILETVVTGEQCGIAVNKENPALTQAINGVLSEMEEDGTLEALQEQYLG